MTEPCAERASTRVSKIIEAPRAVIYQACLDPDALASWRVPDNMTGYVHFFDAQEGGAFRMSLTYQESQGGKTSEGTDTFQGRFVQLIPDEKIVEAIVFESADPRFADEMRITTTFADTDQGTQVTVRCEDIPVGIRPEDNEVGTEQALQKLTALVTR